MDNNIKAVARIRTDFPEKFGIPRQPGVVTELKGRIVFEPEFRNPDMIRGLEDFSHIWLIWQFSKNLDEEGNVRWTPTVRPPRLGGNTRLGVFATRSPFRPNPLGLSVVEIDSIETDTPEGPVIHVKGADMVDGTPIYDIKPYIPYADSIPEAKGGFTESTEYKTLKVVWGINGKIVYDVYDKTIINDKEKTIPGDNSAVQGVIDEERKHQNALESVEVDDIPEEIRESLEKILSNDPRPHYQNDSERVYGMSFAGYEVKFKVVGDEVNIIGVFKTCT